jgi:hypothetical protein
MQRVNGLAHRPTVMSEGGGNFRVALRGDRSEGDRRAGGDGDGGEDEDKAGDLSLSFNP